MSANTHVHHSAAPYFKVFSILMLLTVVTVALSYVDLGHWFQKHAAFMPGIFHGHGANIIIGMMVATIKASLVIWIFMHQNEEENLNRFALAFCLSLFVLAVLVLSYDFVFLGTYAFKQLAGMAVGTHH